MDSKEVDRQLRDQFWPALKDAGFIRRPGRTAWRDRDSAVQCVNVESFNAHIAQRLEATTYSFKLNTGVFFEAIASRSAQGRYVRDHRRPRESQCHVQRFLMKGIDQDEVRVGRDPDGLRSRPDVWLLMPDSANSGDVVAMRPNACSSMACPGWNGSPTQGKPSAASSRSPTSIRGWASSPSTRVAHPDPPPAGARSRPWPPGCRTGPSSSAHSPRWRNWPTGRSTRPTSTRSAPSCRADGSGRPVVNVDGVP